jgi:hypothetical protein
VTIFTGSAAADVPTSILTSLWHKGLQHMEPTSPRDVHKALATRLAHRKISDEVLAKVADRITKNGIKIGGLDFCPYGICIDYFAEREFSLDEFVTGFKYRELRLFPYGILVDDLFRVRVEVHVPEFEGLGGPG